MKSFHPNRFRTLEVLSEWSSLVRTYTQLLTDDRMSMSNHTVSWTPNNLGLKESPKSRKLGSSFSVFSCEGRKLYQIKSAFNQNFPIERQCKARNYQESAAAACRLTTDFLQPKHRIKDIGCSLSCQVLGGEDELCFCPLLRSQKTIFPTLVRNSQKHHGQKLQEQDRSCLRTLVTSSVICSK